MKHTNKPRVAVFPCGTEVGLEINRALRYEKIVEVVGVSSTPCHGRFVYDIYHSDAPWCGDDALIEYLNALKVDFIYPTNEASLEYLTMMSGLLYGKVVGHPVSTVELCGDKSLTYEYLKDKVRVPVVYDDWQNVERQEDTFFKPKQGHSGIGTVLVRKDDTVPTEIWHEDKYLMLEYLPYEEYTVDCFTQNRQLLYSQGRTRENITKGISGVTKLYNSEEIDLMAHVLNFAIPFTGAWFFQVKRAATGELCLMEIGARIAGSSGLSRARGINLPLLHLYEAMNTPVTIPEPFPITEISRSLDVKATLAEEITEIVFDWDDTIMVNGKTNHIAMAFAHKMKAKGMHIDICTRNEMQDFPDIFETIHVVLPSENKSMYAADHRLLIDDSYEERKGWKYAIAPDQVEMFL